jgi:hypothetical protein
MNYSNIKNFKNISDYYKHCPKKNGKVKKYINDVIEGFSW